MMGKLGMAGCQCLGMESAVDGEFVQSFGRFGIILPMWVFLPREQTEGGQQLLETARGQNLQALVCN